MFVHSSAGGRGNPRATLAVLALALSAAGCQQEAMNPVKIEEGIASVLAGIPAPARERLRARRIYFGRQSVGANLVEGLVTLGKQHPEFALRVAQGRSAEALEQPGFVHALNGQNEAPATKIEDFVSTMNGGLADKVDVAFFKFCYVDLATDGQVDALFERYRSALATLQAAHPKTRFMHVTMPLTVIQGGAKATLKKWLGRPRWGVEANKARARFNDRMRKEYAGRQPLFDLAGAEATLPGGLPVTFEDGGLYPALAREFASDGKHLNDTGARWVAAHLIKTLASLPD